MTFVSISPLFHSIRLVDNSTEHYSTTCKQKQTLFLCIQLQAGITHILGGLESRAWLHKLINIYTHNKKTCVNIRLLFCHKKKNIFWNRLFSLLLWNYSKKLKQLSHRLRKKHLVAILCIISSRNYCININPCGQHWLFCFPFTCI